MTDDKRTGSEPVPRVLSGTLNEAQMATLAGLEKFGWQLSFVRRPLFQDPVPVVTNPEDGEMSIINRDGSLEAATDLKQRDEH